MYGTVNILRFGGYEYFGRPFHVLPAVERTCSGGHDGPQEPAYHAPRAR